MRYGLAAMIRKAFLAALAALAASAATAEIRIVALGDSLTHGYGLPAEQGFAPRLEAWLRENGAPEAVVVNAGVSGDTTAGGKARLGWALDGAGGDGADALIVALGGNDLLRALDPASSRANLEGILQEAAARGLPVLLAGMRAPLNYGTDYKAEFDAIYPELAARYGAIHDEFFLEGLVGKPELFQPDGIHPNAAGVEALVARFGPLALKLVGQAQAE